MPGLCDDNKRRFQLHADITCAGKSHGFFLWDAAAERKKTTHELAAVIHTVIMVTAVSEELWRDTKGSFENVVYLLSHLSKRHTVLV